MGKDYKILIVEDEQIIATHLDAYISKLGYRVIGICGSGEEAIDSLNEHLPDLMIVDIMLEGSMTGIDLVKTVNDKYKIPIIYLTSNSDVKTFEEAKATKPSAFLKKPFNREQLKATIEVSIHRFCEDQLELEKIQKKNELQEQSIKDLSETNAHLVTATFRERELKKELQSTKEIIEKQNKSILDSINYAERIQNALIPNEKYLDSLFKDYFMYYKPKDVVSGDFPWVYKRDEYIYIAAVDCTGHGVPGAMMSIIGCLLLNDIVNNDRSKYKTSADLLNELHSAVVKTLKQDEIGNKTADGMDVAMCRINFKENEVIYSGAHRPLYLLRNGEVIQFKGDKYPIGGMQYQGANNFTDHHLKIEPGDSIYFFSDGLPDQFGGPEGRKIGPKKIRQMIQANEEKDIRETKVVFSDLFTEWKGDTKQIDDVLMIGIKF